MACHVGSTSKEGALVGFTSHTEGIHFLYVVHATVLHMSLCVCFILVFRAL